jgi:predicted DNA-binding WGR domain protein
MHGAPVLDQVVDELAALAGGAGLVLELVDRGPGPGRRARFYALHLQPALWGAVDVVRTWGRLGHRHRPRCLVTSHPDEGSARVALRHLVRRRLRRGYRRLDPSVPAGYSAGISSPSTSSALAQASGAASAAAAVSRAGVRSPMQCATNQVALFEV